MLTQHRNLAVVSPIGRRTRPPGLSAHPGSLLMALSRSASFHNLTLGTKSVLRPIPCEAEPSVVRRPWSQALHIRRTHRPEIQQETGVGGREGRGRLGSSGECRREALRAGLKALSTQETQLFLPYYSAALGVKL